MTPDGPARQDGEDGQQVQARSKPAAIAVGDGDAVIADTSRMTAIPSDQRATDSHDYTRLVDVEFVIDRCFVAAGTLHRSAQVAPASTCGPAYTSQKGRQLFF